MSGEHKDIMACASNNVSADVREAFDELNAFVLGSQYVVKTSDTNGSAHCVVRGSGMGLICSGENSDVTFFEQAAKHFVLNKNICELFEIDWTELHRR